MSQGTDGNELPQAADMNARRENEVNPEEAISSDKSKLKEIEIVKVVRSKIRKRESNQLRDEEEDKLDNLRVSKVSSSKVSRLSRLKKVKSKTSDTVVSEDLPVYETKIHSSESAIKTDEAKVQEFIPDAKSRTSVPDETESFHSENQEKKSAPDHKRSFVKDSTFIMSHDVDSSRDSAGLSQIEVRRQIDQDSPSNDTIDNPNYERGNYMNNLAPEPIEEFDNPPDQERNAQSGPKNG